MTRENLPPTQFVNYTAKGTEPIQDFLSSCLSPSLQLCTQQTFGFAKITRPVMVMLCCMQSLTTAKVFSGLRPVSLTSRNFRSDFPYTSYLPEAGNVKIFFKWCNHQLKNAGSIASSNWKAMSQTYPDLLLNWPSVTGMTLFHKVQA